MKHRFDLISLRQTEADLLDKLQRCVPPVDQHRAELERVRTHIAEASSTGTYAANDNEED